MRTRKQKPIPVKIVHDGPEVARPYHEPNRMHMSVRQIQNGFVVNRHGYKDGKHFDHEFYTPHEPKLDGGPRGSRAPSRAQRLGNRKI